MPLPNIIAIDGPAGSGKSSLGQRLSERLGYLFFDTGVMYRAVTWAALERGVPISGEAAVTALAQELIIDVRPPSHADGRSYDVLVDGRDVTWEIRTPEVDGHVSTVSAYPGVRQALASQQRRIGLRGQVIMVGRDIGTVVLPEAGLKIYLDATVEERARRRFVERCQRGEQVVYAQVLRAMQARDRTDSTRQVSPLRPAEDAYLLSSDGLDLDQVVEKVLELLQAA